jgi:hypothetical protein
VKIAVQTLLYRQSVQALCTKSLIPVHKSHVQKLLLQILCTELLYRAPVASSLYNDFSVQSACTEYTASVQNACTERLYMSCTEASVQSDVCTDPPVQKACAVGSGFTTQLMKQSYFYMTPVQALT